MISRENKYRILILEDSASDAELTEKELCKGSVEFSLRRAEDKKGFLEALEEFMPHLILADYSLPSFDGLSALEIMHKKGLDIPFIFVSGSIGEEAAVAAMKAGAQDYLLKGKLARLAPAVMRELKEAEMRESRKKTLAELHESERRYTELINQAPDPIIMLDNYGVLRSVNPAAEQAYGYAADELVGKQFVSMGIVSPNSVTRVIKELELTMTGQKRPLFELEIVHKNRSLASFEINSRPIFLDEKVTGVQIIFRDITQRKRLEAQLLQAQKMETVGTLAGGIAHDLNNQLTPVKGYIDLILKQIDVRNPVYKLLIEANQSAERCTEVISRLMNFSRPSAHVMEPLSLGNLFLEFSALLTKLLPATIRIEVNCEEDVWPITGNRTEIETVFMNLAVNARDAMPNGGRLSFEARNISLGQSGTRWGFKTGPYVLSSVRDTGTGISPDEIYRIFEPFFTTKKKGEGTGLGLAMVFKTIKDHQGWIDVSSEVGRGTVFQIYLPAEPGATVLKGREKSMIVDDLMAKNETILFADDETVIRNLGKQFLERLGYQVLLAADAEEAVKLYEENQTKIHALVLDMTMPKLSGRQMLQKILESNPSAKVLITSGYTSEGTPEELVKMGAKKFLPKPYTIIPLARTLRAILD